MMRTNVMGAEMSSTMHRHFLVYLLKVTQGRKIIADKMPNTNPPMCTKLSTYGRVPRKARTITTTMKIISSSQA